MKYRVYFLFAFFVINVKPYAKADDMADVESLERLCKNWVTQFGSRIVNLNIMYQSWPGGEDRYLPSKLYPKVLFLTAEPDDCVTNSKSVTFDIIGHMSPMYYPVIGNMIDNTRGISTSKIRNVENRYIKNDHPIHKPNDPECVKKPETNSLQV